MSETSKKYALIGTAVILAIILLANLVGATPAPKYFVCKYVGTPNVNETLQTGQNPISVSGNALPDGTDVGDSFADKQGRSYVVAQDTGQDEPECPAVENPCVENCQCEDNCEPKTPPEETKDTPKVETPKVQEDNTPIIGK